MLYESLRHPPHSFQRGARVFLAAPLFFALALTTACGEDDPEAQKSEDAATSTPDAGTGAESDAGSTPDAGSPATDAGVESDAGAGQAGFEFNPTEVVAHLGAGQDGKRWWTLNGQQADTFLGLEIYESYGAPTTPGVVEITDNEASYLTCGTCLRLWTGCPEEGPCERVFMPRAGGRVRMDNMSTTPGSQFSGALEEIVFQEVTIADDLTTTPVEDGQVLNLAQWSFDTVATEVCNGHGHLHGSDCHCDDGYVQDPNDASQCVEEPECSGHGHLHGDHCHCDDGYVQDTSDATRCVAEEPECSGHGHLHGDQCHCDDGYVQATGDATQCVAEAECSGHGHLHGDHCHCDDGYVQDTSDATQCVPE